jgi:hypothetical protein
MSITDDKNEKITTDVQFNISGKRDYVYELLEKLRKIISEANTSNDEVQILVNTNTANMGIESEDGKIFEDEATMIRWQDLQESNVDIDAMIMLNKTNQAVEVTDITAEALNSKINYFTEKFMSGFLEKLVDIIKNMIGKKLAYINCDVIPEGERYKFQHLKFGKINIVLKEEYLHDAQEVRQIIIRIMEEFFENKGVSRNMAKNIDVQIKHEDNGEEDTSIDNDQEIELD